MEVDIISSTGKREFWQRQLYIFEDGFNALVDYEMKEISMRKKWSEFWNAIGVRVRTNLIVIVNATKKNDTNRNDKCKCA